MADRVRAVVADDEEPGRARVVELLRRDAIASTAPLCSTTYGFVASTITTPTTSCEYRFLR